MEKGHSKINIEHYDYALPENRIAKYPKKDRAASRLLVYHSGNITDRVFSSLPDLLPKGARLVFNDTKVIAARMNFLKKTGAHIEIFCLEPFEPTEYHEVFSSTGHCSWKCLVGNLKKWKGEVLETDILSNQQAIKLKAELEKKQDDGVVVRFKWTPAHIPFSKVLDVFGQVPVPPYLNRASEAIDKERYQTVYSKFEGSVAAPTAGLHFTDHVIGALQLKQIKISAITLHVGAGTFTPVKEEDATEHLMHREPFLISREEVMHLFFSGEPIVPVGTTSMRTIESLYWLGVKHAHGWIPDEDIHLDQWEPYQLHHLTVREAGDALLHYLDQQGQDVYQASTSVMIVPGYSFRMCDGLITNFHQPRSTLLLLVSAFIGEAWKKIYAHALTHDYRFLSYGDSSLLVPENGRLKL